MDADERARLRALCEAATPGPWETYRPAAGGLGIAHGDPRTHHGCIARIVAGEPADAALMGIARTALPALLDALDAAEHALREARAEMERLRRELAETRGDFVQMREDRDACKGALARANELRIGDRAEARLDERWACSEFAEKWLREVGEITQDTPADLADAIRARGAGGAR